MISFHSEVPFEIPDTDATVLWLSSIISQENYNEGEVSIVFCDDEFLHKLNVEFLNHDTLTDVISFDYSIGKEIHETRGIEILSSGFERIPQVTKPLDEAQVADVEKLLEKLEEDDDVQFVYHTMQE